MPRKTKNSTLATPVEKPQKAVEPQVSKDNKVKQVRQQLASVIDCTISTARVRAQVTDYGVNADVRESVSEVETCDDLTTLSQRTVEYIRDAYADINKPDEDVTAVYNAFMDDDKDARMALDTEETKKILSNLISRSCARAGDDSICALAATCNYIIEQLASHGVETLKCESKKTLKTHHIANDDITKLSVWPFLRTLPCVQIERDAHYARLEEIARKKLEKKEKDKAKKAAAKIASGDDEKKDASKTKKLDKSTNDAKVTDEKETDVGSEDDDANADDEKKTKKPREKIPANSFCHHVYNIARTIVKNSVDGDVSSAVRVFGSNIVYELIKRYSKLIRLQIEFAGVKTIKANTIITINKIILADAGMVNEEFDEYVSSRVKKYYEHVAATKSAALASTTSVA
jgi:hypothetical protein